MRIRDRIVELRRVPARDLAPNPLDFDTAAGDEDAAISLTPTIGLPVPILDIKSRRDSLVIGNRYGTYRLSHDERRRVFVLQQESIR